MAQGVNSPDGVNMLNANKDVDIRKQPIYESKDDLLAALPVSKRAIGLTLDYMESGNWVTGRFVGGTADADFEEVEMGGTLADTLERGNSADNKKITNLASPSAEGDAANKKYVENRVLQSTDESLFYSDQILQSNVGRMKEVFVYTVSKNFQIQNESVDVLEVRVNRSNVLFLFDDYLLISTTEIQLTENFPLYEGDKITIIYNYLIS